MSLFKSSLLRNSAEWSTVYPIDFACGLNRSGPPHTTALLDAYDHFQTHHVGTDRRGLGLCPMTIQMISLGEWNGDTVALSGKTDVTYGAALTAPTAKHEDS